MSYCARAFLSTSSTFLNNTLGDAAGLYGGARGGFGENPQAIDDSVKLSMGMRRMGGSGRSIRWAVAMYNDALMGDLDVVLLSKLNVQILEAAPIQHHDCVPLAYKGGVQARRDRGKLDDEESPFDAVLLPRLRGGREGVDDGERSDAQDLKDRRVVALQYGEVQLGGGAIEEGWAGAKLLVDIRIKVGVGELAVVMRSWSSLRLRGPRF